MIRIQLPTKEIEHLESILRTTPEPKLRTRVQIVLMAHRGRPHGQIACDTGTSRSSWEHTQSVANASRSASKLMSNTLVRLSASSGWSRSNSSVPSPLR